MNSFLLALMLLFPVAQPPTKPQAIHVGGNVTAAEVAQAKAILAASQPKELKLKVGEFEIIEPSKDAKPLQFQFLTNNCYRLYQVQPGETLVMVGVRRGETERRLHRFEAKPYRWAVIEAVLQGSEVVVVNRNGAVADKDPPEEVERVLVLVGEPKPHPPPQPDPPKPDPSPMPGEGFRVLIVRETKDLSNLPSKQISIFSSSEVRTYLNTRCIKENGQPAYRMWDKDVDASREAETWKVALNGVLNGDKTHNISKATSLPWILLTNGKEGYEGPLPNDVDKMMELLRKYGEGK